MFFLSTKWHPTVITLCNFDQGENDFSSSSASTWAVSHEWNLYPFLTAAHNEVGFNIVPLQVGVSLSSCSWFNVIVPIQIIQGGLGDVYAAETKCRFKKCSLLRLLCKTSAANQPHFNRISLWEVKMEEVYWTNPAFPPASIWFARVTSLDQTSNCHFLSPSTPQCTLPLWIPTRMFTFTPVTSRTSLQKTEEEEKKQPQRNNQRV